MAYLARIEADLLVECLNGCAGFVWIAILYLASKILVIVDIV